MADTPLLKITDVSKSFGPVQALRNVEFTLHEGEIHALLGENGAGKSTLIKVLTGAEHFTEGNIDLAGHSIHCKNPADAQKKGISTVYQEVNLCPNITVAENIFINRQPRNKFGLIQWDEMNKAAKSILLSLNIDIDVTKNLESYSTAIQQMVAIARACDISAKVLVLDEPTSSLTTAEVDKLFEVMKTLKARNMGIIFVTHFLDQVYEVCDKITVLRNGHYICSESVHELNKVQLVAKMVGKDYNELIETHQKTTEKNNNQDVFVSINNAIDSMGKLHPINMCVHEGEVLGFAGLLGSGRSEVARLIYGADKMENGTLMFRGKLLRLDGPITAIRNGMAFCPEDRKLEGIVPDLSIQDNIILALQTKRGMMKPINRREAAEIADKYIDMLQIKASSKDQAIKNLSGGNQQKAVVARWLATQPSLLILDEPTRGIDIGAKAEIQKLILLLAEEGMSVIFISSEIDEMMRCCERMIIMKDKRKIGEIMNDDLTESQLMEAIAGEE